MVYRGLYSYRQLIRVITLFQTFYNPCCFWKESLSRTSSHLHNAARALSSPESLFSIGPLQDPVTWYRINYTGTQMTQWDFKTKESRAGLVRVPLFWKSHWRYLRPSVIYSVPCDWILQRAYCQQILAKISLVIFDIVIKKQIECGLAWHWWNSTDLGLINRHVFKQSECRNLLLVYYYSENHATSEIWKVLPNMVSNPDLGGKMAAFWTCACKLSWSLLSPATGSAPIRGGKKGEFQGLD